MTTLGERLNPHKAVIVALIIALVGVSLVALGATVWRHIWLGDVAKGIAVILLASVLVGWLADFLLRRDFLEIVETAVTAALEGQLANLRRLEGMGIEDVFPDFPTDKARDELAASRKKIRILQTWIGNFEALANSIRQAVAAGAIVEILILSDEAACARLRALDQGFQSETDVSDHIKANKRQISHFLSTLNGGDVQVRQYTGIPPLQMYSGDQCAFIGVFWHGKSSLTATNLQVKSDSTFGNELINEFERRWNNASNAL
ncbi:hypothetical protein [Streptomyces sp. NPDC002788]